MYLHELKKSILYEHEKHNHYIYKNLKHVDSPHWKL